MKLWNALEVIFVCSQFFLSYIDFHLHNAITATSAVHDLGFTKPRPIYDYRFLFCNQTILKD
jgi:hypothetical protein